MIDTTDIIIDKSMRLIARGLAAHRLQTITSGLENIPVEGPALVAVRHYHHLYDGLALFAAIPRRFHILVALDWAQNKPTKCFFETMNRLARWPVMLRADALVRRSDNRRNLYSPRDVLRYQRTAIRQSVDLLAQGRMLVMFPEGYPNVDPTYSPKSDPEEFLRFKSGFVKIVSAAQRRANKTIPIIPAGFHYTRGTPWIAHLRFGAPIRSDNPRAKKDLVEQVESAVKKLSEST